MEHSGTVGSALCENLRDLLGKKDCAMRMCLDSGNAATQLSAPESSTQRKPLTGRGMTQINDQCHEDEAVLDQEEEECYLYEC